MISVVISEKGGTERRARYDHSEITIGRVKGNDILLPKGNVSKKHARLIHRDGRYIVTDLKSTNGTYVNHRRITHATLVREGDRIYIGDFVLKLEDPDNPEGVRPMVSEMPTPGTAEERPSSLHSMSSGGEIISHFPIENDPDDASGAGNIPIPPAAGLPQDITERSQKREASNNHRAPSDPVQDENSSSDLVQHETERRSLRAYQRTVRKALAEIEKRLAMGDDPNLDPDPDKADQVIDSVLAEAFSDDEVNESQDREQIEDAVRNELFSIGPLTKLLDNEHINRIDVVGRKVTVHRRSTRVDDGACYFATHVGVSRALRRLQEQRELAPLGSDTDASPTDATRLDAQANTEGTDEAYVELTIRGGWRLFAMTPPLVAGSPSLSLERKRRVSTSLDSLVRRGAISRNMATLLTHCISARTNILVVANRSDLVTRVVDAITTAVPASHSSIALLSDPESTQEDESAVLLDGQDDARAIQGVGRLSPDHIFVPAVETGWLPPLIDSIHGGGAGLVLGMGAATLRQALSRMATSLAMDGDGVLPQTAHQWIGSAFDIGVEVTRLRDGRLRVARISEIRVDAHGVRLQDIFTFTYHRTAAGGSIEGSFYATGTVPRIVEDLAAHGLVLDTQMFRRQSGS